MQFPIDSKGQQTTMSNSQFATDIITFYHPSFWGMSSPEEFSEWAAQHAESFWAKTLDTLQETGVSGIELTFSPGDIASVQKAFGSAASFRGELESRGLRVISAFIGEEESLDWRAPENLPRILEDAEQRAAFLNEMGAELLVRGLPMRKTFGERPPFFADIHYMTHMADVAHQVGEAIQQEGVKLAIHTESNSTLWYERDIDLFMGLTDPQYVWLCPDSCHIALGGGDPVAIAQRHRPRIALAHWKDASLPIDRHLVIDGTIFAQQQEYMTELGTGIVDLKGWAEAMKETPGAETIMIELDSTPDPAGVLKSAVDLVTKL